MNLEDQYDRIFRYLYFHLHDKHTAEDLTQETFLRFLRSRSYRDENRQLQYLYTIARNLCRQHCRDRTITFTLEEQEDTPASESFEEPLLEQISLRETLQKLPPEDRELIFLHYVNDVPVTVLGGIYKVSRFAVYRKLNRILKRIRRELEGMENES
ncbi:MAG: sigma-70 family RNA polymerase sigma factor [Lachnospiraceae bacterium]|nr:sigma-70 family RNA polymerase sigma factor [Lachnospiraceae bacterium]